MNHFGTWPGVFNDNADFLCGCLVSVRQSVTKTGGKVTNWWRTEKKLVSSLAVCCVFVCLSLSLWVEVRSNCQVLYPIHLLLKVLVPRSQPIITGNVPYDKTHGLCYEPLNHYPNTESRISWSTSRNTMDEAFFPSTHKLYIPHSPKDRHFSKGRVAVLGMSFNKFSSRKGVKQLSTWPTRGEMRWRTKCEESQMPSMREGNGPSHRQAFTLKGMDFTVIVTDPPACLQTLEQKEANSNLGMNELRFLTPHRHGWDFKVCRANGIMENTLLQCIVYSLGVTISFPISSFQ